MTAAGFPLMRESDPTFLLFLVRHVSASTLLTRCRKQLDVGLKRSASEQLQIRYAREHPIVHYHSHHARCRQCESERHQNEALASFAFRVCWFPREVCPRIMRDTSSCLHGTLTRWFFMSPSEHDDDLIAKQASADPEASVKGLLTRTHNRNRGSEAPYKMWGGYPGVDMEFWFWCATQRRFLDRSFPARSAVDIT